MAGCGSRLVVSDNTNGLPVPEPVLMKVITTTSYEVSPTAKDPTNAPALCARKVRKEDFKYMPLGKVRYVNFQRGWLTKSEFKVEYTDAGTLKSVSLNSDPAAAIEASTGLLSAVLPYLGKPQFEAKDVTEEQKRAENCLIAGTSIEVENLTIGQ
jgi:hypothetical protein